MFANIRILYNAYFFVIIYLFMCVRVCVYVVYSLTIQTHYPLPLATTTKNTKSK